MASLYEQALQAIQLRAAGAAGWGSHGVKREGWAKAEAAHCPAAHLIDGDLQIDRDKNDCAWHCEGDPKIRIQVRDNAGTTTRDTMTQRVLAELETSLGITGVKHVVTGIKYEGVVADADGYLATINLRINFICKAYDLSTVA